MDRAERIVRATVESVLLEVDDFRDGAMTFDDLVTNALEALPAEDEATSAGTGEGPASSGTEDAVAAAREAFCGRALLIAALHRKRDSCGFRTDDAKQRRKITRQIRQAEAELYRDYDAVPAAERKAKQDGGE